MTSQSAPPTEGRSIIRALLALAWPVILSRATQAVIGFSDALLVAPLGEAALAAVTTGALNAFTVMILPIGTVFIVQSFAAQLRGRGELEAVRRYAWYALALAAVSAVVAAAAIPFVPALVGRLGYAPEVTRDMTTYVSIRLLSVGGAIGMEAIGNWYGGLGNTRVSMVASVVAMVVNVLGCLVLIQPRFGLPGFGVAGAAWASVLASWLGFATTAVAFRRGLGAPDGVAAAPMGRLRMRELRRMLRFGLPNGINWFLEFAAFVAFINVVVGKLGTVTLAAFNVVMQINSLGFMPAFGLASAGAILVGEAIGRRAHDEVWPIVRATAVFAMGWMLSLGLVYFAAPRALVGLFHVPSSNDDAFLVIGAQMLSFAVFWQLFDALNMTLSEALRAAGDTTWCMWTRIVIAWLVFTPIAWSLVLYLHGGVVTVMASLIGYLALLSGAFALRFAGGKWRSIELVEEGPSVVDS